MIVVVVERKVKNHRNSESIINATLLLSEDNKRKTRIKK